MSLEGVLGPNNRLEEASGVRVDAPEALCVGADGRLLFSSGRSVLSLEKWGDAPQRHAAFDRPVTALCSSPGGLVAVGTLGGGLHVLGGSGSRLGGWKLPDDITSVADMMFVAGDDLVIADPGYGAEEPLLSVATWDDVARGRLLAVGRSGAPRLLATGLRCPMGVAQDARGEVIVTEFGGARIVDVAGRPRRAGYPGYLGRLRRTGSGYVMACLSRRDPLIDFLRTERAFINAMKSGIAPQHWIAPRISPDFSHHLPIELGATRLFGRIKPWAPSFSYGLVIEMDGTLMPVGAAHSRADGRRHAVSDALVWRGDLLAVSKASGELLNLGRARDGA